MTVGRSVEHWLANLGLGQYVDAFKSNDIDFRSLQYLDDNDLREMGVTLGHRRILMSEIQSLKSIAQSSPEIDTLTAQDDDAERRQVAVMFCDVVGSVSLSQNYDPEEFREIIRQYQMTVTTAVRRYQGYVARFVGDGIFSYFGWPRAYEDQAERAIRAGLETLSTVSKISVKNDDHLRVRIGIETGLVVVGDLVGEATSDYDTVIGDTPNLASRLLDIAEANQLVIGTNTHDLVGSAFELEDLGSHSMKGFARPVQAWSVLREHMAQSRFESARGQALTDLVGRTHELGLLKERWELAREGEGQVILLSGEAGIGKSRLARDFKLEISNALRFNLIYQCSPHHTSSAFYPVIQRLQRAVGFKDTDSADTKLDKLEKSLQVWGSDVSSMAPLFAELMSAPGEQRYGPLDLSPQQLRQRTIDAMVEQVLSLSKRRPVYMLIEDAHWIDPSMKDFVSELIPRITDEPVFILVTYRQDNAPDWSRNNHLTSISLNRLGRRHASRIALAIGGQGLMDAMIDKIVLRADGVPLYIEELTKSVLESFTDDLAGADAMIPATLQSSLIARLDRLEDAKEIAQIGAVIGREFSHRIIASLSTRKESEINACLEKLVSSGLVFKRGVTPNEIYTFKHALVQDAAYNTILISRRRRLHGLIVDILEQQTVELSTEKTELLAHHSFMGEIWDKAFRYLQKSGQKAMDRAAVREAVSLFEKALSTGAHLAKSDVALTDDIDLRFDLRNALWSIGEFEQILRHLKEAERLAERLDDPIRRGWIFVFTSASQWQLGRSDEAQSAARKALELNRECKDLALEIGANFYLGCATVTTGQCLKAEILFGKIINSLSGEQNYERYGLPFLPAVISRSWLVWALAERGEFNQARDLAIQALEIANTVGHPFNIAHIYYDLGYLYYIKGDFSEAVKALENAHGIITEWSLTYLSPFITGFLGHAYTLAGMHEKALTMLETAVTAYEQIGLGLFRSLVNAYLGMSLLENGRAKDALQQAELALALARKRGEHGHEACALQILGKVYLHPDIDKSERARNCLTDALVLSQRYGMRPLESQCSRDLGEYFADKDPGQSDIYFTRSQALEQKLNRSV